MKRRRQPPEYPEDKPRRGVTRWRAVLIGALVLAILGGASWALLGSSLLVVRHVSVIGNRLVTAAAVRNAAKIKAGAPLATVNTAAAADRVEQIAPVLSAEVTRSWPDTIVITVRERTPALAVAANGGYDLIDEHGVTVQWAAHRPASLPLLTTPPAVLRASPAVLAAVTVLHRLPARLRKLIRSVSAASASAVTLHLAGGVTVLWGGPDEASSKSAELDVLLGTHARYYDVSDPSTAVSGG